MPPKCETVQLSRYRGGNAGDGRLETVGYVVRGESRNAAWNRVRSCRPRSLDHCTDVSFHNEGSSSDVPGSRKLDRCFGPLLGRLRGARRWALGQGWTKKSS